jgi:DNA polymerase-4
LSGVLKRLCEQLAGDLQRKGYVGRTVGIKLRFEGFVTVTRDVTLGAPMADAQDLLDAARSCLKRVDLGRRLRLLGVRIGNLSHPGNSATPGRTDSRSTSAHAAPAVLPENLSLF